MKNRYDIESFYSDLICDLDRKEIESDFPSHFYKSYYDGKRKFYLKQTIESKKFDDTWIKAIEMYFPSINKITKNVRSTLKYQSEILPIEKTKKISKESIRHLSAHSNLIREVNEDGVIPKQILSSLPEIEFGIYENRFIMTLIFRLRDFINRRIKIIEEALKASKETHFNVNSSFNYENADYEMQVDIKGKEDVSVRKTDEHNEMVLERAQYLYRLINRLYNCQFMKIMKKYKPVNPPIMKTQVILKNPDFKNAYLLWLYLDKYNELSYDLDVQTTNKRFSPLYNKHINQTLLMVFSTLLVHEKSRSKKNEPQGKIDYKEKRAKSVSKLPTDVSTDPIAYEVEDRKLNEYYLNKNKLLLKKQIDSHLNEDEDCSIALRKAMAETLKITNSVYESYFEINAEDDVFQQLIKVNDPETMMDDAFEKYKVAKIIREVKEKDYKDTVKLEKKWQKELANKQRILIKDLKKQKNEEADKKLIATKNKYDKQKENRKKQMMKEKAQLLQKQKKELNEYKKSLNENLRQEKAKMKLESNQKLAKEKERLKKQQERQKIKDAERLKKQKQKLREKQKAKKQELKSNMTNRIKSQKELEKMRTKSQIENMKNNKAN